MGYDHVIFASYGNDSLALIQWGAREKLENVAVAYSDTGWASRAWNERVRRCEEWGKSLGFTPHRIPSIGMEALVRQRKGWPLPRKYQFCTTELKIVPAQRWLDEVDPGREAVCMVGVRREESRERADWPEYLMESNNHGGRELWSPLVGHTESDRDQLLIEAGFKPLPTRSQECFPCINANRGDMRLLTEERLAEIERLEKEMGFTSKGKPRTMFRPYRHMGATGIREVHRWALSDRGKFKLHIGDGKVCDSGMCSL